MARATDSDTIFPRILRETIVALVRRDGADLTARQLAVFLVCYLEDGPHTVRGLSERTGLPKPAISRVLDRLGALSLTRRVADPRDKRSVLVACTAEGFTFLKLVRGLLQQAAATARQTDDAEDTVPDAASNGG